MNLIPSKYAHLNLEHYKNEQNNQQLVQTWNYR